MKVAIYARFSTDRQSERSIEDQLALCRRVAERAGHEVVKEYSDAAISGTHAERPGLQAMLAEIAASKGRAFGAVLVESQSRLSRDLIGALELIYRDLARHGVRLLDASGYDSTAENGKTLALVNTLISSQYVEMVAKMTHRGLDGRARAGYSTGGSLYGYRTEPEPNPIDRDHPRHLWKIDETEGAIVRRIYDLFLGGKGYKPIADLLNREGIPSPRNNGRGGKHGAGWAHTSVRAILSNPKYVGRWAWNATKWVKLPSERRRRRVERPESELVARDMPELAIVDEVTFARAQKRVSATVRGGNGAKERVGKRAYLVGGGLLRCGVCGGPMSIYGQRIKNGVRYASFACTAHKSRGGSICSNGASVSEKRINAGLIGALRDLLTGDAVKDAFAKAFAARVNEVRASADAGQLARDLAAAQKRATNATRLLVDDPDDAELRRLRDEARGEVRRLESEVAAAKTSQPETPPDFEVVREGIGRFLTALAGDPALGHDALVRVLPEPLVVTPSPKTRKPALVVSGLLSLSGMYTKVEVAGARLVH